MYWSFCQGCIPGWRGRPMIEGKTVRGTHVVLKSPAKPALHMREPMLITSAAAAGASRTSSLAARSAVAVLSAAALASAAARSVAARCGGAGAAAAGAAKASFRCIGRGGTTVLVASWSISHPQWNIGWRKSPIPAPSRNTGFAHLAQRSGPGSPAVAVEGDEAGEGAVAAKGEAAGAAEAAGAVAAAEAVEAEALVASVSAPHFDRFLAATKAASDLAALISALARAASDSSAC